MSKRKEKAGTAVTTNTRPDQPDGNSRHEPTLDEVVAFCQQYGLTGSVVGRWVWVFFDEKPDEAVRKVLKDFGFRWSARRGGWAHNCGTPSRSASKSSPFEKYEVQPISEVA
jgi:hypothetical protein